jgi:hypothetical protein
MRHMNWKTVSTLVTMAVIAGCAENATSPTMQSPSAPAAMSLAPQGRPQLQLNGNSNAESADFNVGAKGGVFFIGNHAVAFPAKSVCDPETSGYGLTTWNASCTPLRGNVRVHATVHTSARGTWVDFSPELRFVPSNDPSRWVWLYMYLPGATAQGDLSKLNILYSPNLVELIDESKDDSTMRTYVGNGVALRRIKHFSGYGVFGRCETECASQGAPEP